MPARDEIPLDDGLRDALASLTEKALITEICDVRSTPMVPEVRAYLATDTHRFWRQGEEAMAAYPFGVPFWGIPWAGGLALARWLLDNPEQVCGKSVWCFAAGAGIEAVAALKAGASRVVVNDIDPIACKAAAMNAALNGVVVETCSENRLGRDLPDVDVFLAGDFCYDENLARATFHWLKLLRAAGTEVFVGDPGRVFLSRDNLSPLWRGAGEPGHEYDDPDIRRAAVFCYS